jgi:ABC-2 type transport system ATP-binding protein
MVTAPASEATAGGKFGFLGPNGAGKSTTTRMLSTLVRPTTGAARINGHDVVSERGQVRRSIGVVFQEQTLDHQLTVLHGMPRRLIAGRVKFSGGRARPDRWFDPETRAPVWCDIRRLRDEEGVTVLLSAHDLAEAANADRVVIIDHGRIVSLDTPSALKGQIGRDTVRLVTAGNRRAAARLVAAGMPPGLALGADPSQSGHLHRGACPPDNPRGTAAVCRLGRTARRPRVVRQSTAR